MKVKQLREAIRSIIKQELNENQPKPATTPNPKGPSTLPGPKIDKPDEKRRKIGNPSKTPKKLPIKNLKEEEMIDKITKRFLSKKKQMRTN